MFIAVTGTVILSDVSLAGSRLQFDARRTFGEIIPFHNTAVCLKTISRYLPMPHLSSELI